MKNLGSIVSFAFWILVVIILLVVSGFLVEQIIEATKRILGS